MKVGDKIICIKEYITYQDKKLFSVGEITTINKISDKSILNQNELVYVGDINLLMESSNDNITITDLVGTPYFVALKESRKRKIKKINNESFCIFIP